MSAADYLELVRHYDHVLIDRIPKLNRLKLNEARRFITLIDAMYENKVGGVGCDGMRLRAVGLPLDPSYRCVLSSYRPVVLSSCRLVVLSSCHPTALSLIIHVNRYHPTPTTSHPTRQRLYAQQKSRSRDYSRPRRAASILNSGAKSPG